MQVRCPSRRHELLRLWHRIYALPTTRRGKTKHEDDHASYKDSVVRDSVNRVVYHIYWPTCGGGCLLDSGTGARRTGATAILCSCQTNGDQLNTYLLLSRTIVFRNRIFFFFLVWQFSLGQPSIRNWRARARDVHTTGCHSIKSNTRTRVNYQHKLTRKSTERSFKTVASVHDDRHTILHTFKSAHQYYQQRIFSQFLHTSAQNAHKRRDGTDGTPRNGRNY